MTAWPKDNQAARNAFYGDPGKNEIAGQMVPVIPPFKMYYDGKRVNAIQFHKKAAPALIAALNEIWDACGHDQAKIDAAGVSKYAGAYNRRMVRGSSTKWSNHAYAAAIDLNAGENAMGVKKGTMPQFVVDAFCRQGAMWGGWYKSRPDWMHFEFVDNGGRKPKFGAPVLGGKPLRLVDDDDAPADDLEDTPIDPGPPPHAVNVQPPSATYRAQIETAQRCLDKLGYHEVGEIDGLMGGKTKGAIAAFLNDRGLKDVVTNGGMAGVEEALSAAVAEGWSRPIAPSRANATAQDIAPKVEAVRQSLWQRFVAKVTGAGAGLGVLATGAASQFGSVNEQISPVKEFFTSVPGWAWFAIIAAAALALYLSSNRTALATTSDYNTGKIN